MLLKRNKNFEERKVHQDNNGTKIRKKVCYLSKKENLNLIKYSIPFGRIQMHGFKYKKIRSY